MRIQYFLLVLLHTFISLTFSSRVSEFGEFSSRLLSSGNSDEPFYDPRPISPTVSFEKYIIPGQIINGTVRAFHPKMSAIYLPYLTKSYELSLHIPSLPNTAAVFLEVGGVDARTGEFSFPCTRTSSVGSNSLSLSPTASSGQYGCFFGVRSELYVRVGLAGESYVLNSLANENFAYALSFNLATNAIFEVERPSISASPDASYAAASTSPTPSPSSLVTPTYSVDPSSPSSTPRPSDIREYIELVAPHALVENFVNTVPLSANSRRVLGVYVKPRSTIVSTMNELARIRSLNFPLVPLVQYSPSPLDPMSDPYYDPLALDLSSSAGFRIRISYPSTVSPLIASNLTILPHYVNISEIDVLLLGACNPDSSFVQSPDDPSVYLAVYEFDVTYDSGCFYGPGVTNFITVVNRNPNPIELTVTVVKVNPSPSSTSTATFTSTATSTSTHTSSNTPTPTTTSTPSSTPTGLPLIYSAIPSFPGVPRQTKQLTFRVPFNEDHDYSHDTVTSGEGSPGTVFTGRLSASNLDTDEFYEVFNYRNMGISIYSSYLTPVDPSVSSTYHIQIEAGFNPPKIGTFWYADIANSSDFYDPLVGVTGNFESSPTITDGTQLKRASLILDRCLLAYRSHRMPIYVNEALDMYLPSRLAVDEWFSHRNFALTNYSNYCDFSDASALNIYIRFRVITQPHLTRMLSGSEFRRLNTQASVPSAAARLDPTDVSYSSSLDFFYRGGEQPVSADLRGSISLHFQSTEVPSNPLLDTTELILVSALAPAGGVLLGLVVVFFVAHMRRRLILSRARSVAAMRLVKVDANDEIVDESPEEHVLRLQQEAEASQQLRLRDLESEIIQQAQQEELEQRQREEEEQRRRQQEQEELAAAEEEARKIAQAQAELIEQLQREREELNALEGLNKEERIIIVDKKLQEEAERRNISPVSDVYSRRTLRLVQSLEAPVAGGTYKVDVSVIGSRAPINSGFPSSLSNSITAASPSGGFNGGATITSPVRSPNALLTPGSRKKKEEWSLNYY